jgi:hypothetical protein
MDIMDNNLYNQDQRTTQLFDDLPRIRNQAKEEIIRSQDKQKKYHDKKNKRKEIFKIGDKVLYYNTAKEKQWSGKLEERFKGPYYIHEELLDRSYKIKELSGKILKIPVNEELLNEISVAIHQSPIRIRHRISVIFGYPSFQISVHTDKTDHGYP